MPNEFFTLESMLTLSGATGATLVVTNGLQYAFGFSPKWLGLLIAQAITISGALAALPEGEAASFSHYFVAIVNGFLVFCAAAGGAHAVGGRDHYALRPRSIAHADTPQSGRRSFWAPWF